MCDELATEAQFLVIYACLLLTKTYRFLWRAAFPWMGGLEGSQSSVCKLIMLFQMKSTCTSLTYLTLACGQWTRTLSKPVTLGSVAPDITGLVFPDPAHVPAKHEPPPLRLPPTHHHNHHTHAHTSVSKSSQAWFLSWL